MARFHFNLQAVLDHREMIEEQKQLSVAALERERTRLEDVIRGHQAGITRGKQDIRAALRAGDIRGVRLQTVASAAIVAVAQRAVLELAGLHRRLEAARADLLEATKRRKAVELLKERRLEEWRTDQNRRELAAVDELVVMGASRKDGEA
jgi:flagellar FliJ protein